jgi:hypothetical protein
MAAIPISTIVTVSISLAATRVTQAGFGTPLIIGNTHTPPWVPQIREYFNLTQVLADYTTSNPEYIAAAAIFGQSVSPISLKIAQQGAQVAEIETLVFSDNFVAGNIINAQVNGVAITPVPFNTDNATTLSDLATVLQATAAIGTAVSDGVHTITMTSATAGIPFTVTSVVVTGGVSQPTGVVTITTPNHGIVEDIQNIQLIDDDWYGLIITSRTVAVVDQVAAFIQTQKKIFATASNDPLIITAGDTTNIAYRYRAAGYTRTMVLYNANVTTRYIDAAEIGNELARDPGTYTMNLKTLQGQTVDTLTATQYNAALGYNANVYVEIGGVNVLRVGTVASGLFIDEIRFIDWLQARIEERIYFLLVNTPKVPYTDPGAQLIVNQIQAVLQNGVKIGGLAADPAYTVTAPKVADQSPVDRADRYFPGILFTAQLASAIHHIGIQGTVTV